MQTTITCVPIPKCLNPSLWLDAADPSGNQVLPSSGTSFPTWVDKSGNGNNATQAVGANQPTWNSSVVNSKPAIQFNGTTQFYSIATFTNFPTGSAGRSHFMVLRTAASLGNTRIQGYGTAAGGFVQYSIIILNTGGISIDGTGISTTGTPIAVSTNYIYSDGYTGGTSTGTTLGIKVNNASVTVTGTGGTLNTGTTYNNMGSGNAGLNLTGASIAEVLYFTPRLSSDQETAVYSYLSAKWGI